MLLAINITSVFVSDGVVVYAAFDIHSEIFESRRIMDNLKMKMLASRLPSRSHVADNVAFLYSISGFHRKRQHMSITAVYTIAMI